MVLYKVLKTTTLTSMGRERTFKINDEVTESIWTKYFPEIFSRVGEVKREPVPLADSFFIPDPITEFVNKEKERNIELQKSKNNKPEQKNKKPRRRKSKKTKEVSIDELVTEPIVSEDFVLETEE